MTENTNTAASAAGSASANNGNESFNREKEMAEYEKEKQVVKELLQRRNQLSRNIVSLLRPSHFVLLSVFPVPSE